MRGTRDPTSADDGRDARDRAEATVHAHLDALLASGDCGESLADDVRLTIMGTGETTCGREAVAALLAYLHRRAFAAPPIVRTLIANQETAMIEAEFAGVHAGEFAGIAPTGRQVRVAYTVAYDCGSHSITAVRLYLPLDTLVQQLRES
ncbi:MAG: ester cyclase [Thermomicrobiales bacterium]|nr:ester cyclase [Thermomicrobiales bacterium]